MHPFISLENVSESLPPNIISPYLIPMVPASLAWRLQSLVGIFQRRTGRCISIALVLHRTVRNWSAPLIPPQICDQERAIWQLQHPFFSSIPAELAIAGSVTASVTSAAGSEVAHIPPIDGVHLCVQEDPHGHPSGVYWRALVRSRGVIRRLPVAKVVYNDWREIVYDHAHLMTFTHDNEEFL